LHNFYHKFFLGFVLLHMGGPGSLVSICLAIREVNNSYILACNTSF
jgi:hypothetical protein